MDFDKVSNPQKKWRRSLFIANVVETSQERNISHLSMLESTHRDRVECFGVIRRKKIIIKAVTGLTQNAILQSVLTATKLLLFFVDFICICNYQIISCPL
jgi:hypothetical protein